MACREPFLVLLQALPCHQRWVFLMESCRTLGPVGSAALSTRQRTQHRERERSGTAVRTLQVYLTQFGSGDLIFGETGHQAPADGSCAHRTNRESSCDAPDGTIPLGLLHIHRLLHIHAAPVDSTATLEPVSPLGAKSAVHQGMDSIG